MFDCKQHFNNFLDECLITLKLGNPSLMSASLVGDERSPVAVIKFGVGLSDFHPTSLCAFVILIIVQG